MFQLTKPSEGIKLLRWNKELPPASAADPLGLALRVSARLSDELPSVRNVALRVAQAIALDDQATATALFERLSATDSHVNIVFGQTSQEFWRYAIILMKIVDGRFDAQDLGIAADGSLVSRYGIALNGPIKNRIEKWNKKREGKLFGRDKPDQRFLR